MILNMGASSHNRIVCMVVILAFGNAAGCKQDQKQNNSLAKATPPSPIPVERNRMQFVTAIQQVKPDMLPDDVRRLLGEPDDIVTDVDLPPNCWSAPFESWNYGTNGHCSFPMLGSVTFREGVVSTFTGYSEIFEDEDNQRSLPPPPPSAELISESELRHLLAKIHATVVCFEIPSLYDPLRLIQAVNALQSAGTAKAIASLKEYARLRTDESDFEVAFGVECILKASFDTGGAIDEPPGLWTSVEDLVSAPQHPLMIIDGIPFLIARPGGTTGAPRDLLDTVYFFEQFGSIRADQLIPPNRPIEALQKLIAFELADSQEPTAEHENNVREEYLPQICMLIRSAHPLPLDENGKPYAWVFNCDGIEAPKVQQEIEQLDLRWDSDWEIYVRPDGSYIPDVPPLQRARIYWRPTSLGMFRSRLTLKRSSLDYAWVELEWEQPVEHVESQFIVQFTSDGSPLVEFQIPKTTSPHGWDTRIR